MSGTDSVRMTIDVPKDLHTMIKMSSTLHNQSIKRFVIDAIQSRMKKEKFPNKLTLETIEKAEKGIGLHSYKNVQEFIDDMKK